jgi:hypothetical protein
LGTVYAKQTTGGGTPYLTAFGYNAGGSPTGIFTVAVGNQALSALTTGGDNVAVGYQAAIATDTGSSNTTVGSRAFSSNTSGVSNVAIGNYTLVTAVTAVYNTAVGAQALQSSTGGSNTAIGYAALGVNTTGFYNVGIGLNAGNNITTGRRNTMLGTSTNLSDPTDTDSTVIGSFTVGKGINTAFIGGTNGAYQANNSAAWSVASDKRLKKNIVDNNIGLDKILSIKVRNFEYRTNDEVTELPQNLAIAISGTQLGVIAQELQEILPDCVKEQSTGVLSVNSENIMWHMINAIKELSAQVNELKTKVGA